jgi:hypothetical protein
MQNVIRTGLLTCAAVFLLSACATKAPQPVGVHTPSSPAATLSATWTADAGMLATSTVKSPKLPTFPKGSLFVVDRTGAGKAVALFTAPQPRPERWSRVAKFTVEMTVVDGLWVDSLTFWGDLDDDTVVTTQEQKALGSSRFVTVSRRVGDILRDNPDWRGFDDGSRVSLTFTSHGNSPVKVLSVTALDPTFRSVTLAGPGPVYSLEHATDPIVRNAIKGSPGETATIVGYLTHFENPGSGAGPRTTTELVVGRTGALFWRVGAMMSGHRSSRPPDPRVGPESRDEAAVRKSAVAVGERTVRRVPGLSSAKGTVVGYLVRVGLFDGTRHVDVFVQNNGDVSDSSGLAKLQPWSPSAD